MQVQCPGGVCVQQHNQQLEGIQRHGVLFFQHCRDQGQNCIRHHSLQAIPLILACPAYKAHMIIIITTIIILMMMITTTIIKIMIRTITVTHNNNNKKFTFQLMMS